MTLVARNRWSDTADAMRGIAVGPFDQLGRAVVEADVANELASEIVDGGEDTSGNDVAFDLREPIFDLIEPRRVCRREMQSDVGMICEELIDTLGLMSRKVVEDDVDFFASGLAGHDGAEESHELSTAMAVHRLAQYCAGARVERGVQRQRPMPVGLEAVALQATWAHWQHRIQAIQRLDRCFLVNAKHRGMLRRIEVKPNHVGGLLFEVRIVRAHVALDTVRLDAG